MIKQGDTYYVFSTGPSGSDTGLIPWRSSKNLASWTRGGSVFPAIPKWAQDARGEHEGDLGAGHLLLQRPLSSLLRGLDFRLDHSVIGLATNTTLDPAAPGYVWEDQGLVLSSDTFDKYNCIDPSHFIDRDGKHWLCFGSFWTGIKIIFARSRHGQARIRRAGAGARLAPAAARRHRGAVHDRA